MKDCLPTRREISRLLLWVSRFHPFRNFKAAEREIADIAFRRTGIILMNMSFFPLMLTDFPFFVLLQQQVYFPGHKGK